MPELFPFTVTDLIACVEREVKMRRRVYPRRVADRKMSQQLADLELAKMEAIAEKLRELAESE